MKDVTKLELSVRELRRKVDTLERAVIQVKPVYTTREAVGMFGVKPQTLRRWRQQGVIGYSQTGKTILYSAEDIRRFMQACHKDATTEAPGGGNDVVIK